MKPEEPERPREKPRMALISNFNKLACGTPVAL